MKNVYGKVQSIIRIIFFTSIPLLLGASFVFAQVEGYGDLKFNLDMKKVKSLCPQFELTDDQKNCYCRLVEIFGETGMVFVDFKSEKLSEIRIIMNLNMNKLLAIFTALKQKYAVSFSSDYNMFKEVREIEEFIQIFEDGMVTCSATKNVFNGQKIVINYRNSKLNEKEWEDVKQKYTSSNSF